MKKHIALILSLAVTITIGVGCSNQNTNTVENKNSTNISNTTNSENKNSDTNNSNSTNNDTNKSDDIKDTNETNEETIDSEGIYIGQIDSNSIEIKINGEPKAFKLSDDLKENFDLNTLEPNTKINFQYKEASEGQDIIMVIEKNSESNNVIKESGVYVGQIDSNSVEIKINGEPKAFRLSDELKSAFENTQPKNNSSIEFQYTTNEVGQNVIIFIEKYSNGKK